MPDWTSYSRTAFALAAYQQGFPGAIDAVVDKDVRHLGRSVHKILVALLVAALIKWGLRAPPMVTFWKRIQESFFRFGNIKIVNFFLTKIKKRCRNSPIDKFGIIYVELITP